jgi:hypothetical protein
MEEAAKVVGAAGGHARLRSGDGAFFAALGRGGVVGKEFDLDALATDYSGYLAAAPTLMPPIEAELERLARLAFADLLEFDLVEVEWKDGRRRPETVVRCGLLLGFPPATSAALILGDHRLPGGYTNY